MRSKVVHRTSLFIHQVLTRGHQSIVETYITTRLLQPQHLTVCPQFYAETMMLMGTATEPFKKDFLMKDRIPLFVTHPPRINRR